MAFTTPATVVTGTTITAAWGNTHIRDNIRYLKGMDGAIAFESGASFDTNVLVVDATNNRVGVVQGSPAYPLDVNGRISYASALSDGADIVLDKSGTILRLGNSSTWTELRYYLANAAGVQTFYTNNLERMRIAANGRVGIGRTAPAQLLHVAGAAYLASDSNADTGGISIAQNGGSEIAIDTDSRNKTINFHANALVIGTGAAGNVGIGAASAGSKLHVAGTFRATGTVTLDGAVAVDTNTLVVDATNNRVGIGVTSPAQRLHVAGTTILATDSNASSGGITVAQNGGGEIAIDTDGRSKTINFHANALIVSSGADGTIGIGKTPTANKLDVAGTVAATLFSGSGASLTNLPAANLTGTLPAISGANLTNLDATDLTGTINKARLPANLVFHSIGTLVAGGATQLAPDADPFALVIIFADGPSFYKPAMFWLYGSVHATAEVSDPDGGFSASAANSGTSNIYWSAANSCYELYNATPGTRNYWMLIIDVTV